jgi:imidazolonepropionase
MRIIFKNIKELLQVRKEAISFVSGKQMAILPSIKHAYLVVENGLITDFGSMDTCPEIQADSVVDASGKMLMPSWCDAHTHIVYAGNREAEFVQRIQGMGYEEIAAAGGGILNSAKKLQETSEDSLYEQSSIRLEALIGLGTGAIEIKSGYGLTLEAELKMLRVIRRLKEAYPIEIKATFLGAHAVPEKYKGNKHAYLKMLIDEVLPKVAKEKLAEYIDIFCEKGYFDLADTALMLAAGKKYGWIPKIHVNQFSAFGGVGLGVQFNALSVDHLEEMRAEDIEVLKETKTMPVALPGCSFFLGIPYTPARKMIQAGLPLALASDYNPGSSPSGNMNLVVSLACIKMKMTPEEAINAATINGAYAMGLENEVGSISIGKQANLILTKPLNSYAFIPYAFGSNQIEKVIIKVKEVHPF